MRENVWYLIYQKCTQSPIVFLYLHLSFQYLCEVVFDCLLCAGARIRSS
jgi:hypothetical protein